MNAKTRYERNGVFEKEIYSLTSVFKRMKQLRQNKFLKIIIRKYEDNKMITG